MTSSTGTTGPSARHGRTALFGLALAVLAGGCVAPADLPVRHAHQQPAPAGSVNATDLAWLQLMIAMDERVLPLLDVGASRGHAPAVRQLAGKLRDAHVTELARLRSAGPAADNPHAGHDMPGMVTAAELARLRSARGPTFDALFTDHLGAHLRQSLSVTRSEQLYGADSRVKALAAAIERTRLTQLPLLRGPL